MDLKYNFKLLLICHTHNRQKPPNRIQNRNNNIKKAQYDHLFAQTAFFVQKLVYFCSVLTNTNVQNEKDSFYNHLRVDGICIERTGPQFKG
jgi:hypothetical protein